MPLEEEDLKAAYLRPFWGLNVSDFLFLVDSTLGGKCHSLWPCSSQQPTWVQLCFQISVGLHNIKNHKWHDLIWWVGKNALCQEGLEDLGAKRDLQSTGAEKQTKPRDDTLEKLTGRGLSQPRVGMRGPSWRLDFIIILALKSSQNCLHHSQGP